MQCRGRGPSLAPSDDNREPESDLSARRGPGVAALAAFGRTACGREDAGCVRVFARTGRAGQPLDARNQQGTCSSWSPAGGEVSFGLPDAVLSARGRGVGDIYSGYARVAGSRRWTVVAVALTSEQKS